MHEEGREISKPQADISVPATEKGRLARWFGSDTAAGLMLISPAFLFTFFLLAVPLIATFAYSFWTQVYLELDKTPTLVNYVQAWTEPIYRLLMLRSLWISMTVTLVTVVLAYPLAYFIAFHVKKNQGLWLFLVTIPFWSSYLLRVFAWKIILGYNGVLNSGLIAMGVITEPLEVLLYNPASVIITLAHAWAAFAILPIYVSLRKIDPQLLEAATDLGDGRRFIRVTLPLSMPGVIGACLVIFIPTVGDYVTPALVGGTDGLMIGNMIQVQFGKAGNFPLGAALAMSAMLVVASISLLFVVVARYLASKAR